MTEVVYKVTYCSEDGRTFRVTCFQHLLNDILNDITAQEFTIVEVKALNWAALSKGDVVDVTPS